MIPIREKYDSSLKSYWSLCQAVLAFVAQGNSLPLNTIILDKKAVPNRIEALIMPYSYLYINGLAW